MTAVRVLIADTREVREIEGAEMGMPPEYAWTARRGYSLVPMRPKSTSQGTSSPSPTSPRQSTTTSRSRFEAEAVRERAILGG
jgi:hypothetical protein